MASAEWYYARGNQQYGPVSPAELRALAEKGVLGPDDLVWRAGMSDWVAARRIKGLFEPPVGPSGTSSVGKSAGPGVLSASGAGAMAGQAPVPSAGQASPMTTAGVPPGVSAATPPAAPASIPQPIATASEGSPAGSSAEAVPLASTAPPAPRGTLVRESAGRALVTFERSSAAFERSRLGQRPHLFDYLLDALGAAFPGRFTEGTGEFLALVGHYGLYAAMLLVLVMHGVAAVQSKAVAIAGAGLAVVLALAALQYACGRFSSALSRLDRTTTGQMVSTAVPDSLALVALLAGVGLLIASSVAAVALRRFEWVLTGVAGFVVFQYAAMLALNAESLGISISREITVGEEAIGLVTLLAKLGVRLGPAVLTAGVLWGTVMLGYAVYMALAEGSAGPRDISALGTPALPLWNNPSGDDLLGSLGAWAGAGGAASGELDALAELGRVLGRGGQAPGVLRAMGPLAVAGSAETVLLWSAAYPVLAYAGFLAAYVLAEALRILLHLDRPEDEHKAEDKSEQ